MKTSSHTQLRTARTALGILLLLIGMLLLSSCNWDPLGLNTPVDKAIAALEGAIHRLDVNSDDWQATLTELQGKIAADTRDILKYQVDSLLQRAIIAAGAEQKCVIDMIGVRVKASLEGILASLKHEAIPESEPELCYIDPLIVDSQDVVKGELKALVIDGYDFDLEKTIKMWTQLHNGQRIDVTHQLQIPTMYHMTLNLGGTNGVQIPPDAYQFVLQWKNKDTRTIGIHHTVVTPPPVAQDCHWTAYTSEELAPAQCSGGYAVKGMKCQHDNCDNVSLYCCGYMPNNGPDPAYSPTVLSPQISEESPNNHWYTPSGFVVGLRCEHDYCDNVTLKALEQSPNLVNRGQCDWWPYFSEEGANTEQNQSICGAYLYVAGLQCKGSYCDDMSLLCCKASKP